MIIVDVLPENEPPLIIDDTGNEIDTLYLLTQVNSALEFCINVIDPDNDLLSIENIETILNGGIYVPQPSSLCLEFIPTTDYIGTDIHLVRICDNGNPEKCDSVYVKIEVVLQNSPPIFLYNGLPVDTVLYSVNENIVLDFCLDYIEPDGNNIMLEAFDFISGEGSFTRDVGELCFNYNPAINYFGNTWLTVTICDDAAASLCADLVIGVEVRNVNQKPSILFDGVLADTLLYRVEARNTFNTCIEVIDKDGDIVSISTVDNTDPNSTSNLSISDVLCFEFTPGNNFLGTEWYTLTVCDDGTPSLCDTSIVGIEVYSINTPPQIRYNGIDEDSIYVTITEGELLTLDFELVDLENDGLQVERFQIDEGAGLFETSLTTELQLRYRPDFDVVGIHQLLLTVCDDGLPILCDTVIVSVNVIRKNTSPNAVDDDYTMYSNDELIANVLDNDTDIEDDSLVVEIALTNGPETGTLELNEAGDFTYTAPQDYLGTATFTYTICDIATTSLCSSANVLIHVEPRSLSPFQAFSPNGDGFNDFWKIQGIEHYPDNQIKIFDRWNNLVFEIDGYNNRDVVWKGEANRGLYKKDLDNGTYYYIVIPGNNEETRSGMVILKR